MRSRFALVLLVCGLVMPMPISAFAAGFVGDHHGGNHQQDHKNTGQGEHHKVIKHIEGRVVSVAGSTIVVSHNAMTATVVLSTSTVILVNGQITTTLPLVGDKVQAKGLTLNPDGSYTAQRVLIERPRVGHDGNGQGPVLPPGTIKLEGVISSMVGSTLVLVHDRVTATVYLSTTTVIVDSHALTPTLAAGMTVKVYAAPSTTGNPTALRVVVQSEGAGPVRPGELRDFEGRLVALTTTSVSLVKGGITTTFALSAATVITVSDPVSTSTAVLALGQIVHVKALADASSTWTAVRVVIHNGSQENSRPQQAEAKHADGRVVSFDGSTLVIGNSEHQKTFALTSATSITTTDGSAVPTSLVGLKVKVTYTVNPDGSFSATAVSIEVAQPNNG